MNHKKILILYASAGAGHKKAAEAICNVAKSRSEQLELIDVVDFMPSLFKRFYTKGYILLITRFIWLWTILYFLSDVPFLSLLNVNFRKFLNAMACRRFIKYLLGQNPDVVISTQFLASEIVSYTKEKFHLKTRLMTVVTDFGVHNFWISSKTDVYCCAAESTKQLLIKKGIDEGRIKITGIPVDEKFTKPQNTEYLLSEFKLKKDLFTVLIVTGGIGVGPIEKIVELLKEDVQLLVVCGYNSKLYNRLAQRRYENVRLFGFVDYIEKLMRISQLIVTKAGGLTVTESLVTGLPMIFFFLIPGQEMTNAKMIEARGAGIIANSPAGIKKAVFYFKNNQQYLASHKNRVLSLARPNSSSEIISLLDSSL